jgi:hypothetical protein
MPLPKNPDAYLDLCAILRRVVSDGPLKWTPVGSEGTSTPNHARYQINRLNYLRRLIHAGVAAPDLLPHIGTVHWYKDSSNPAAIIFRRATTIEPLDADANADPMIAIEPLVEDELLEAAKNLNLDDD